MVTWMKIEDPIYELPVAVAATARELAEICQTTTNNIYSQMSQYRRGKRAWRPFICVVDPSPLAAELPQ